MPHRPDLDGSGQVWRHTQLLAGEWCFRDGVIVVRTPDPGFTLSYLDGWAVSGPPERPTVTPSIRQYHKRPDGSDQTDWHGFLTDGQWLPCGDSPPPRGHHA
jgi:hypothetical protein